MTEFRTVRTGVRQFGLPLPGLHYQSPLAWEHPLLQVIHSGRSGSLRSVAVVRSRRLLPLFSHQLGQLQASYPNGNDAIEPSQYEQVERWSATTMTIPVKTSRVA